MSSKFCLCCESDLCIDDFYKCASAKDGHQAVCKKCTKCRKSDVCLIKNPEFKKDIEKIESPIKEELVYKECVTEYYKNGQLYKKRIKKFS